jgi:glycosyltransferase involved in cell wall biosynthesis
MQPRSDLDALVAVRRVMTQSRSQLVHSHMAKAGAIGRLAARSLRDRPRTVHTFHGHVLDGYFGRRVEKAFLQTERWLAKGTDVLIAISPEIRDSLLDLGIGRASQYRIIPLGLDLSSFLAVNSPSGSFRHDLGLTPDVPLVGAAGRLVPIKDISTLLSAMAFLPGVHLAIIGDGELRPQLESEARAKDLAGRVHFTGWRRDMAAVVADLDVVALTSRNEGTPVALIEALAARRAVTASDVGGVRSVVRDGLTGLLSPVGDVEQVARNIDQLLSSPSLRERLGKAGRQHVTERFSAERLVQDVRLLYRELLGVPQLIS